MELGLLKWVGPLPDGAAATVAKQDALTLQRLWRSLTPAEPDSSLQSATLIQFMMVAFSPDRERFGAQGEGFDFAAGDQEGGSDAGQSDAARPPLPDLPPSFSSDATLVSDFGQLYRNTLSYKS